MDQANWRWLMFRGVLGILFGVALWLWPLAGLTTLALVFALYVVIDGVSAIAAAISTRNLTAGRYRWGWLLVEGVLGLVAGSFAVIFPPIAVLSLIVIMSVWALLTGALELVAAYKMRNEAVGALFFGLAGVVSVAFAILLVVRPEVGALAVVSFVGAYSILYRDWETDRKSVV